MRSASMGAQESRTPRRESARQDEDEPAGGIQETEDQNSRRTVESPRQTSLANRHPGLQTLGGDGGSESGSGRSSANPYRSRMSRGGAGRRVTPPQGSTSSFGGAGTSMERADSSVSGSWGRGGRRSGSRPENRFDEDEFPFAMEKSDFNTGGKSNGSGASER